MQTHEEEPRRWVSGVMRIGFRATYVEIYVYNIHISKHI